MSQPDKEENCSLNQNVVVNLVESKLQNPIIGSRNVTQINIENVNIQRDAQQSNQQQENTVQQTKSSREKHVLKKIIWLQDKHLGPNINFQSSVIKKDDIPTVYPIVKKIDFYTGEATPENEECYPSRKYENYEGSELMETRFEDLLQKPQRFLCLIGPPGSGKTVYSKRLAKSGVWPEMVCLHINFADINYQDSVTLKEVLIDKAYPELSKDSCKQAFQWIVKNDTKVALIIDGFDEAAFKLSANPAKESYDTPRPIQDIIALLFSKHFLRNCLLIITSRPHPMNYLPESLRPDTIYYLGDFSPDDTKLLFFSYAGEKADNLWENLNSEAPDLIAACHNPLMLQLVISVYSHPSFKSDTLFTWTRLFDNVMDVHQRCKNIKSACDPSLLKTKLAKLAFCATNNNTITITKEQIRKVGLNPDDVQDVIVELYANKGPTSCRVLDCDVSFHFYHLTFQEWFTAFYIVRLMQLEDFQAFLKDKWFDDHWLVVRQFVSGLLLDQGAKTDFLSKKREALMDHLVLHLEKLSKDMEKRKNRPRLLDLYVCVFEANNQSLTRKAVQVFPAKLNLSWIPLNAIQVKAVCFLLEHLENDLQMLHLLGCRLNRSLFQKLASTIKKMKPKIEHVNIGANYLHSSNVEDIIEVLEFVKYKFELFDCFSNDDGGVRYSRFHERAKIQAALHKMNDSNLTVKFLKP
ncbi:unnamed protein product [Clavelina lepadiformis]|uniref:NACHT domain-containing protein n=1 Tax=Clavelina lepadiformis TaxID=159417 RepID=A0ABP0GAT0_CLALP